MIRKFDLKLLPLITCLLFPALAFAVTKEEMEEARTIATQAYLRYANDGSGYLDEIKPVPKTMAELEAKLNKKEKENIIAFKAIPVPSDYASWDKDKLVEYWGVTAFQSKGLLEKGKIGRTRAKKNLAKMTIAPPQAASTVAETPASSANETPSPAPAANPTAVNDTLQSVLEPSLLSEEPFDDDLKVDKAYNYTWVYIMVLAILVAVVLVLVVYAANVMKKNGNSRNGMPQGGADPEEIEHLESVVADKEVEITMLRKKLDNLTKQNNELKNKVESLTATLAALKSSVHAPSRPVKNHHAENHQVESGHSAHQEDSSEEILAEVVTTPKPAKRSIFLGRANVKGIFVRADRTLNVGNSVFVLDTTDGFSGTFRVADSPVAWSLALSNPREYLETACTGHDLSDTDGYSKIVTETSGTAVFEGGCWRVIRKARIRYE